MRTRHAFLKVAVVSLVLAGLLVFMHPLIWAQVDTSEGGGEEYEALIYGRKPLTGTQQAGLRSLEEFRLLFEQREVEYLKDRIRETELIQNLHRKLDSLEKRVKLLESVQGKLDGLERRVQVLESLARFDTPPAQTPDNLKKPGVKAAAGGVPKDRPIRSPARD